METLIDCLGSFAFAVSGIRLSATKNFDWFGALTVGFITTVGGGTLRDILLGLPPFWVFSPHYLIITFVALIFTLIFKNHIVKIEPSLYVFDAIGLGLFTIIGIEKTLSMGYSWWVAIMFGIISGCVGGVVRDILINETPLLFRKEIYALACIIGGMVYFALGYFGVVNEINTLISAIIVITVRMVCLKYNINLPQIK